MPIKRRKIKQRIKPKPKSKHVRLCEDLYNRLQQPGKAYDAFEEIADLTNMSMQDARDMVIMALDLASRCTTTVNTLQVNYPDHVSYRVRMTYEDRSKKPKHGFLFPSVVVVKTSPSLALSVMLAYIELSKNLGRFP